MIKFLVDYWVLEQMKEIYDLETNRARFNYSIKPSEMLWESVVAIFLYQLVSQHESMLQLKWCKIFD